MKILMTGAAGGVGTMLSAPLAEAGHLVRRTDLVPSDGIDPLDVTDPDAVAAACAGMNAIVHLGGIPSEAGFDEINRVNVGGTHNVLLGAVGAGVRRVILASSNHAVGFHRRSELPPGVTELVEPDEPRPDTYYGWSKVATEALGRLFHDRFGLEVVALRIGSCYAEPPTVRSLATWLSPLDAGRLVNACLVAPGIGYEVLFAVSDNTRRWWSLARAEAIGYRPVDDAERFAAALIARYGAPDPADPDHDRVGGEFCRQPLGDAMR